ncbi:MAG TPA: thioredoxin domain-containing protein [Terracidiphilus sp.]
MIRPFVNTAGARLAGRRFAPAPLAVLAALAALSLPASQALAQQQVPPAPAAPTPQTTPAEPAPTTPAEQGPKAVPPAPAPSTAPVFPKPDPKNFTATTPTKETVDAFLHESWGYDTDRVWQVQAILKTPIDGVSKVVIFVGDKTGKMKPSALAFFTMPDGKHLITGDQVIDFGAHPFADYRAQAEQRANGPSRGAASKNLELVEFADFECPHCKEAQANMDKLAQDFPQAHIVFQFYPLESIHPEAKLAAEYGYCVNKIGGSEAFFKFASAVFDGQQGLATSDGATLTLNSSVIKAGLDPKKVAACAALPATSTEVENSVKLAQDLNIFETPMLVVNGREVPPTMAYDTLKKIIEYQAKLDGVPLESASASPAPAK